MPIAFFPKIISENDNLIFPKSEGPYVGLVARSGPSNGANFVTEPALHFTEHALARCASRGVPPHIALLLLQHGDLALHAGEGCESLRLGRDAAAMLLAEGADPDTVARARRLAAVIGGRGVVTILRPRGQRGRRYSRQFPTRARRA